MVSEGLIARAVVGIRKHCVFASRATLGRVRLLAVKMCIVCIVRTCSIEVIDKY